MAAVYGGTYMHRGYSAVRAVCWERTLRPVDSILGITADPPDMSLRTIPKRRMLSASSASPLLRVDGGMCTILTVKQRAQGLIELVANAVPLDVAFGTLRCCIWQWQMLQ